MRLRRRKADRSQSESALYGAIADMAQSVSGPDDLKSLSQAHANVAHGPQGGEYSAEAHNRQRTETSNSTSTTQDTRYRGETDYHETRHEGELRDRPPLGFGGEA